MLTGVSMYLVSLESEADVIRNLLCRFVCWINLHSYEQREASLGSRQRGVTGRRVCPICKNEQVRKPWYKNMLNWGGWSDV